MTPQPDISRRRYLLQSALGFGSLALGGIVAAEEQKKPNGEPHFQPKAKRVIWLFMRGGVSHMESFDPKPALNKFAGKSIGDTPHASVLEPEIFRIFELSSSTMPMARIAKLFSHYKLDIKSTGSLVSKSATGFHISVRALTTLPSFVRCGQPTTTMELRCNFIPAVICWTLEFQPLVPGSTTD